MPKRTRADYALLWANGASFGEVYDLMKEDLRAEWEAEFEPITPSGAVSLEYLDGSTETLKW
jgi:hypothetical protein